MPKPRRVVHQIERKQGASFDDQMWPVNLALLILAGFTAGIILVKSNFSDHRIFYNGWVMLVGLGVSTTGLLCLAYFLNNHWLARRLQLAVLVSVMIHLALALYMNEAYMEHNFKTLAEQQQRVTDMEELPTLPEYYFKDPEEIPQQDFEKPVETASPEAPSQLPEAEPTEVKEGVAEKQEVTLPEPIPDVDPSPVKMPRQEVSTPRRADENVTTKGSRVVATLSSGEDHGIC